MGCFICLVLISKTRQVHLCNFKWHQRWHFCPLPLLLFPILYILVYAFTRVFWMFRKRGPLIMENGIHEIGSGNIAQLSWVLAWQNYPVRQDIAHTTRPVHSGIKDFIFHLFYFQPLCFPWQWYILVFNILFTVWLLWAWNSVLSCVLYWLVFSNHHSGHQSYLIGV